ncbi:GvpL/GvpF-family gas vesicle protein 3 [Octadecabacter antarcticus 307]|uniref:GvpL/GvpF-family gas vesicle protein 3 n=1 Tax=Octadecabacter antarcticus 307 TaxID=391626 RepID=M9RFJ2_9RHOB|nr:GvpL/GvpF family gas vesicle protein [Octadecabacter antarcticus]AGI68585.1 GvpL/GvpF-family gas vesicle protein 3 [Octadecabacter antarcticus 307]
MRSATSIVYAYGVLTNCSDIALDMPRSDLAGLVKNGPLRILPFGNIAAVVCDFVLPNGSDLETLLEDSRSAERLILNHHQVLSYIVSQHTILPLRFGAAFTEDAGVIAALGGRCSELQKALGRIDGALEWGVKTFCDRKLLKQRVRGTGSEISDLESEIAKQGEGKAFFLRRRKERLILEEVEEILEQCVVGTQEQLEPSVIEEALVKLQPPTVHGHEHDMLSNISYLIARGTEDAFMQSLEDLRLAHAPYGLEYQMNGPWPAYSFSDQQLEGGVNDQ